MDRLWAPWRLSYVRAGSPTTAPLSGEPPAAAAPPKDGGTGDFIAIVDAQSDDRTNLVVTRTDLSIVILNRFPYSNGHLLVAPRRAIATLEEMTDAELLDNQLVIRRMIAALASFMKPDGFNVGLNMGRAAGAGLPSHLHWHVVPRWNGDTNFMTVLGDARVIVQSLDELWLQLRHALGLADS